MHAEKYKMIIYEQDIKRYKRRAFFRGTNMYYVKYISLQEGIVGISYTGSGSEVRIVPDYHPSASICRYE